MLAFRPDLKKGKLVRSDDQEWTQKGKERPHGRPQGSHRIKPSWIQDRHEWLDEKGVPVVPNYYLLSEARRLAEHEEIEYCTAKESDKLQVGGKT